MLGDARATELLALGLGVTIPGILVYPVLPAALRSRPHAAWAAARTLGCLLWAWLAWIVASAGLFPYGTALVAGVGCAMAVLAGFRIWREGWEVLPPPRRVAPVEIVFWGTFLLALAIIPFNGEVTPRTERFVDLAILARLELTRTFPPADTWAAGSLLTYYYYFGFVIMDVLRRLSQIELFRFFNYALAVNYALFVTGVFGAAWSLLGRARAGLWVAAAVCLGGNLSPWWDALGKWRLHPVNWFGAARVIPGTITEFPLFSFAWGDLHPYVLAFPIAAAAIVLLFTVLAGWGAAPGEGGATLAGSLAAWRGHVGLVFWIALVVGALFPCNSWDFPPYLLLLAGPIFVLAGGLSGERQAQVRAALAACAIALLAVALFAPFYAGFGAEQGGRGLKAVFRRSDLIPFLLIWGPHLLVVLAASFRDLPDVRRSPTLALLIGLVVANLALEYGARPLLEPWLLESEPWVRRIVSGVFLSGNAWTLMFVVLALQFDVAGARWRERVIDPLSWMAIVAMLMILAAEFVLVDDHYSGELERMNTVFKVYTQAWILLTFAAAGKFVQGLPAAPWSLRGGHPTFGTRLALAALALGWGGFVLLALPVRYGLFGHSLTGRPPTLDALGGLRAEFPADAAIVRWLRRNSSPDARIVEATANAYEWPGRIATFAGRSTVMGWQNHVAGWRNEWGDVRNRSADVDRIYRAGKLSEIMPLLRKYQIDYVIVGIQERSAYPAVGLAKFERCEQVFRDGAGSVFRCSDR